MTALVALAAASQASLTEGLVALTVTSICGQDRVSECTLASGNDLSVEHAIVPTMSAGNAQGW
jgi:hypothetical protein